MIVGRARGANVMRRLGSALLLSNTAVSAGTQAVTARRACQSRRRYKHQTKVVPDDAQNPLATPPRLDPGVLHLVPVPIGNAKDFSIRVLEVLRLADVIVCTNRLATKVLMEIIDIDPSGRLIHYHGDESANRKLRELMLSGSSMALVVPSGMPVVGDEGGALVRDMVAHGVRVSALPGPSSIVAALAMSGASMPDGTFFFGNMLSTSTSARCRQLAVCKTASHPCIFFESPKRIQATLGDLCAMLPQRRVSIVHEISKVHESVHSDTAEKLFHFYNSGTAVRLISKGQLVLIVEGSPVDGLTSPIPRSELEEAVARELANGASEVSTVAFLSSSLGVPVQHVKRAVAAVKERHQDIKASDEDEGVLEEDQDDDVVDGEPDEGKAKKKKKKLSKAGAIRRRARLIRAIEKKQERLRLLEKQRADGHSED